MMCECGLRPKEPGRRYCPVCEAKVRKAMVQSNYLTYVPARRYRPPGSTEKIKDTKYGRDA